MSGRKIVDLLQERHRGFSPLQKLLRQSGNQASWTAQFGAVLPDKLARDCRVIDVRGSLVVVVCSNAGAATRLRFMAPELLDTLRQLADFRGASTLQIRVTAS
jgi:hypothetical protein